jgi:hypothetical protein
MRKKNHDPNWGGKRERAGRPRSSEPRCACGRFTQRKAERIRHKCRTQAALALA